MNKLYSDADLWDAMRQKARILGVFWGVTAGYAAGIAAILTWFLLLPYNDPLANWLIAAAGVWTALYLFFCFPYLGICFKRSRAYCKMLKFISIGLKEYAYLPFEGIEDWTTRDGVDVNVATFSIRNVKKDEEMIRQVYIDGEKDFPPFEEGKRAKLILQGNLLIEYELEG